MLLRPRNPPKVWWVESGAGLLVVLRLIPLRLAGQAVREGTDVYLFLIGMMLLSALGAEHGVFDLASSKASRIAQVAELVTEVAIIRSAWQKRFGNQ
jgi:arsenical pump membrane protein